MNTGLMLVFGLAAAVIALVWFFFMAPLEKQMHQRRLEMIQRKLEKRNTSAQKQGILEDGDEK